MLGGLLRRAQTLLTTTTVIVGFVCLLTFVFVLYQPTHGPGLSQRVGWQSWDSVSYTGQGQVAPTTPETSTVWWNASLPQDDDASYPTDAWMPLWPHHTGLSEISVSRCFMPPGFVGDMCAPDTTPEYDAIKGKWVRVDRDLNKQSGVWTLNLYYRRARRLDIPLITDIILLPPEDIPPHFDDSWTKAPHSIRDGIIHAKPLFLWYKTGKTMQEMSAEEKNDIITEIDVLFGDDRPWFGFDKLNPPVTPGEDDRLSSVHVTYRKGVKPVPRAPPLHFSNDGRFKILQVADLHFSVTRGLCRETILDPCIGSDNITSSLLGRVLDAENPDFVVFTGDQLNGQGTSWDSKSVLAKFAVEVTDRKIPWAAVFGNHDDENGDVREEQSKMMQALPYSLVESGPKELHGVGNYVLKVKSADSSMTHLLTLYFLDSGAYSKGYLDWFGFFSPTEYDWIHKDQIEWFLQQSSLIEPIDRPFRPPTSDNVERQSDQITPTTRKLARPNALMFFHIPLQESYGTPDVDSRTSLPLDIGIHDLEDSGAAKSSDGMFENGLLKALESDHVSGGGIPEVKVVANGHCHITEDCKRINNVWLCFGGGGSYSGYGKIGFDRRFRVYDISDYGETIKTYKRSEHDEVLDVTVLAGLGAASYDRQ